MNDRDRLSPVSLSGEDPVAQLVIDGLAAVAELFDDHRRFLLHLRAVAPVPVAGIDQDAGDSGHRLRHILDLFAVLGDYLNDRKAELLREGKVSVVMGGYAHDGARAVIRKDIIGEPDRNLFPVHRIDRIGSGEDAGLLLILHAVDIGLVGCFLDITLHLIPCLVRLKTL